ncbi:MAG: DUF1801 domain-containing protein [Ferruginibacter sp.]
MLIKKIKPTSIEEYIDAAPIDTQKKLLQLHACIRKAAPGATESLKWRMPAYSYQKILVTFAVFKQHIGFYPMPSAIKDFAKDLSKYKTASGSVQFPLNKPLPLALITKIVKFRVKESEEGSIKWRS